MSDNPQGLKSEMKRVQAENKFKTPREASDKILGETIESFTPLHARKTQEMKAVTEKMKRATQEMAADKSAELEKRNKVNRLISWLKKPRGVPGENKNKPQ